MYIIYRYMTLSGNVTTTTYRFKLFKPVVMHDVNCIRRHKNNIKTCIYKDECAYE